MSSVLSADQLNSFLEKLDILCAKIKEDDCPVCDLKLTEDKSLCSNGHGICGSCKLVVNVCPLCSSEFEGNVEAQDSLPPKRPRQETENGESAANGVGGESSSIGSVGDRRKCVNSCRGCQMCLPESEMADHEMSCTFRLYTCKICSVEICMRKLQGHCERSHQTRVIMNNSLHKVREDESRSGDKIYYMIHAHNEIFWFWRSNTDRSVFTGLQYCGNAEKVSEFKYLLEVVSANMKSSMKFRGPVLFDTSELPRYSHSEDFIMIGKNFLDRNAQFKVTVQKV